MFKKIGLALSTIVLCAIISLNHSPLAAAHVLKQDNGITAVMHIAPFDDPSAGESTRIEFEYGSDGRSFSLSDYQVSLQLTNADKVVIQEAVPAAYFGSASQGVANVAFPAIGVYTLKLTGKPTTPGAPAFQMSYDIRVAKAVGMTTAKSDGTIPLIVGATVLIVFGMIAVRQVSRGGRYASSSNETNKTSSKR